MRAAVEPVPGARPAVAALRARVRERIDRLGAGYPCVEVDGLPVHLDLPSDVPSDVPFDVPAGDRPGEEGR